MIGQKADTAGEHRLAPSFVCMTLKEALARQHQCLSILHNCKAPVAESPSRNLQRTSDSVLTTLFASIDRIKQQTIDLERSGRIIKYVFIYQDQTIDPERSGDHLQ